jgi:hypothetical protein
LGATTVDSIDASPYEGATIVHDLNEPYTGERYSLVCDAGTLEHVFNYPVALASCMEMVELGGHFVTMTPANNLVGHGFYQVSPDLLHRALSESNGFRVCMMAVRDDGPFGRWHRVADPADRPGSRVQFRGRWETYIFAVAQRVAMQTVLTTPPVQSDYANSWATTGDGGSVKQAFSSPRFSWRRHVPPSVRQIVSTIRSHPFRRYDPRVFPPLDLKRGSSWPVGSPPRS